MRDTTLRDCLNLVGELEYRLRHYDGTLSFDQRAEVQKHLDEARRIYRKGLSDDEIQEFLGHPV